jgi:hypothetical protein
MTDSNPESEFLTEDELLDFDDIKEEDLIIPEWGNKKVRIRGLTLEQMAAAVAKGTRRDARGVETVDREAVIALTLAYGMVKPKISPQNVARLKAKSAGAITRISAAINALGPTSDAIEEAAKSHAPGLNGAISVFPGPRAEEDA